ncbi:MAG: hypothetical protein VCE74_15645 [Alphaproteobacteria bacterium]
MIIRLLMTSLLALLVAMSAAAASDLQEKVQISKKDCRWLVRHQPSADAAFQPGVGVNGRRVKPADLDPGRQIKLPPVIAIPLQVPLSSLLKKGTSSQVGFSDVGVGLVTVDRRSGEVTYEGRSLAGGDSDRLVLACRKLLRGKY